MPPGRCRELRALCPPPKNENEYACHVHRAKGETFPSLGGTASAVGFPPRGLCYSPARDCRKRDEFTIPDLGET